MAELLSFLTGREWRCGKRKDLVGPGVYFMDGAPTDKLVNLRGVLSNETTNSYRHLDATSFAFDDTLAGTLSAIFTFFVISYELAPIETGYHIRIRAIGVPIPEYIMSFDMETVEFGFVRCSYIFGRNAHTYVLRGFFDGPSAASSAAVATTFAKFRPWSEELCIYSPDGWGVRGESATPLA